MCSFYYTPDIAHEPAAAILDRHQKEYSIVHVTPGSALAKLAARNYYRVFIRSSGQRYGD
jgi:hypothetical protein